MERKIIVEKPVLMFRVYDDGSCSIQMLCASREMGIRHLAAGLFSYAANDKEYPTEEELERAVIDFVDEVAYLQENCKIED